MLDTEHSGRRTRDDANTRHGRFRSGHSCAGAGGRPRADPVDAAPSTSGAAGVIVPRVHDADEVRTIVENTRYPPVGLRGFGPRRAGGLRQGRAGSTRPPPTTAWPSWSRSRPRMRSPISRRSRRCRASTECWWAPTTYRHPLVFPAKRMANRFVRSWPRWSRCAGKRNWRRGSRSCPMLDESAALAGHGTDVPDRRSGPVLHGECPSTASWPSSSAASEG